MTEMTHPKADDMLERVLLREVELARANEALRHEHFERRRVEKVRQIFSELGEQLINASVPRRAADVILDAADHLFGWDAGLVDVYSEEDKRFHPVVRYDLEDGERTEILPSSTRVPFTPLREQLFREGPILILRGDEQSSAEELLLTFGSSGQKSASLMFVPMLRDGRIVGVLSIQSYQLDAYSRKDLELLEVLGNYCCHGLERAFAESHLRTVRQKLNLVADMTSALIWTANEEARVLTAEGSGWQNVGFSQQTAVGELLPDLFPGCLDLMLAHESACQGKATDMLLEYREKRFRCRLETMLDATGRPACCLAVAVPVTES